MPTPPLLLGPAADMPLGCGNSLLMATTRVEKPSGVRTPLASAARSGPSLAKRGVGVAGGVAGGTGGEIGGSADDSGGWLMPQAASQDAEPTAPAEKNIERRKLRRSQPWGICRVRRGSRKRLIERDRVASWKDAAAGRKVPAQMPSSASFGMENRVFRTGAICLLRCKKTVCIIAPRLTSLPNFRPWRKPRSAPFPPC